MCSTLLECLDTPNKEHFTCRLCGSVLLNAVQWLSCGHRFCRLCAWSLELSRKGCPSRSCDSCFNEDGEPKLLPDRYIQRELANAKAHYLNSARGCPWKGVYSGLGDHVRTCWYDFDEACSFSSGISELYFIKDIVESDSKEVYQCLDRIEGSLARCLGQYHTLNRQLATTCLEDIALVRKVTTLKGQPWR